MGWISVEDDQPHELFRSMLVFCNHPLSGKLVVAAHYEGNDSWLVHERQESNFNQYITHWMPLPEPPEAGE